MIAFDRSLLRVGERVCCAVSGGADSVAMLLAAAELNSRKESLGVVLSVLHVHHGLRGHEADEDEIFVRALCERLGVTLTVVRVDTAARQQDAHEGVEEAARQLRYAALWDVLDGGHAEVGATAHTLDDQAETVVMKLLRGGWTEGLGGIAPVLRRPETKAARIVRPLLGVRRAEVEAFLHARGQGWREDATNRDLRLTRNRVRHTLMPELRTFNPQLDELLARTAEIARDEEAFWKEEVDRVLPQLVLPGKPVRGGGRAVGTGAGERSYAVEIARLKTMPLALVRRVLRAACRQLLGVQLNSEETGRVLALASLAAHPTVTPRIGARLDLRAGLRIERSARELQLSGRFGVNDRLNAEKGASG